VEYNKKSLDKLLDKLNKLKVLGANNHANHEVAENEYYATPPKAVEMLLKLEKISVDVLEPFAGGGHISKALEDAGHEVVSSDLYYHGYEDAQIGIDFFEDDDAWSGDIVSNPPYSRAPDAVRHALEMIDDGDKVCFFLKVLFLEGQKRKLLFNEYPPKKVWISSSRIACGKNGVFDGKSSAVAYAWIVWEKGFSGPTVVDWFN
jgi:hypothetical protein